MGNLDRSGLSIGKNATREVQDPVVLAISKGGKKIIEKGECLGKRKCSPGKKPQIFEEKKRLPSCNLCSRPQKKAS